MYKSKREILVGLIFGNYFRMMQTEESPAVTVVTVDTPPAETPPEDTPTEQAVQIIETAAELAAQQTANAVTSLEVKWTLDDIYNMVSNMRQENAAAHDEIRNRLTGIEIALEEVEEEIDELPATPPASQTPPSETPPSETPPEAPPQEPEAPANPNPQPRGKRERKWL